MAHGLVRGAHEWFPCTFRDEDLGGFVVGGVYVQTLADGDIFDARQEGREIRVVGLVSDPLFQQCWDAS